MNIYAQRDEDIAAGVPSIEEQIEEMRARYEAGKAAKKCTTIACAYCGKEFVKGHYSQVFCCPKHKDKFWNFTIDSRRDRASIYA